jgi:hypothetical protein
MNIKKIAGWTVSIVAGLVVIGSCVNSGASSPGSSLGASLPTNDALSDVVVAECNGSDGSTFDMGRVTVKVTNSTDRVQSYMITVSMNDASGARLAEANGAANSVAPGQVATTDLFSGTGIDNVAACTVAGVSRFPS